MVQHVVVSANVGSAYRGNAIIIRLHLAIFGFVTCVLQLQFDVSVYVGVVTRVIGVVQLDVLVHTIALVQHVVLGILVSHGLDSRVCSLEGVHRLANHAEGSILSIFDH